MTLQSSAVGEDVASDLVSVAVDPARLGTTGRGEPPIEDIAHRPQVRPFDEVDDRGRAAVGTQAVGELVVDLAAAQ